MAVAQPDVIDEDDLTDADRRILDVLKYGARTKGWIVDETGLHRNTVGNRLDVLNAGDAVTCIHDRTALYELVDDPRESTDTTPTTDAPGDIETLQTRIETLEESLDDYEETIGRLRAENEQLREADGADPDALADVQDCLERALAEIPDDVPGRGSIEDCQTLLERVVGDS